LFLKLTFLFERVDFIPIEDDGEKLILTVKAYKYMDSSLINVDVQPNYVRVSLKGKSLQLALEEEVKSDSSTALRSQTTGYLVIQMPKVNPIIRPKVDEKAIKKLNDKMEVTKNEKSNFLEVDESKIKNRIDLANIVNDNKNKVDTFHEKYKKVVYKERENSPDFVDNCDVPPLE
jgi:protein TilB